MSCSSGNPCFSTGGCGCASDPCNPNNNINCDSVIYSGPNLPCSGVEGCDTLCVALQKLDNAICTLPLTSVTASNGLYKTGSDIRMGGALIEPTVVSTNGTFTLSLTGLVSDPLPDFILTQTTFGVVRITPTSTLTSNILALVTADNGITKTLNNFQLGGALIKPTTITATNINTLSIPGLVNNPSATYIVTIDNTTGLLTKSALSIIVPPNITADNGLTKTGANIQLGGTLIQPTIVATSVSNTLSIQGLVIASFPDYILTETNTGVVEMTATSTLTSNILSGITADNGLTKTANNIQLGGPLIQNTSVDLSTYTLSLKDVGSANTGLDIIPGASAPTDWTTSNVNIFSGKVYANDLTWIDDANVGIGVQPLIASTSPRLAVTKVISNGTTTGSNYASEHKLKLPGTFTSVSTTNKYAANVGVTEFYPDSDIVMSANLEKSISGVFGEFIFEPSGPFGNTTSSGRISAIAARGYFVYDQDLDTFAGIRVMSPISDGGSPYSGALTECIGLKVENQRASTVMNSQITNSYGIKQLGASDRNYFNGTFQLPSTNVSIGTTTLVAGTKTVLTTAIKTGSKIFLSVNTPGGTQGFLSAPTASIVDTTSFVINSTSATDTSTVNWWIINN